MPFQSKAQMPPRVCKYCPRPAGKNITASGRNKGYYRTCGAAECLQRQHADPEVLAKKRFRGQVVCELCRQIFTATSGRQKWCATCVPNKSARRIAQRYGMSADDHAKMNEVCPICRERPAIFVDHDHKTGKVRGKVCGRCNTALAFVENSTALSRALCYLGGG